MDGYGGKVWEEKKKNGVSGHGGSQLIDVLWVDRTRIDNHRWWMGWVFDQQA